ncbi:MAG: 2-octaprenyl-6-methoxyphenyl hydroxylase [Gammaproteobacteria bacterium]|nr:2-octaprenyl-6-methoxyphenyl hydroxylase [Gammaproteobacteria bacterium]
MQDSYDVLIVGGGMTGASLACALGGAALRVGVIEAVPVKNGAQPSFDTRTTALTWGTRRILEAIGVWPRVAAHAVPIKKTHVSDQGRFGFTRLDCADYQLDALGYVVENRMLGNALLDTLQGHANIEFICPARVQDVETSADAASITLHTGQGVRRLSARLLVVADGRHSTARERLNIKTSGHAYGQSAIITSVTPQHPHEYTAYERFAPEGPLAVLPMSATRCAVVWVVRSNQAPALLALDEDAFLARLQQQFGGRLGKFSQLGARRDYALELMRAGEFTRPRAVLIGNAAHTLHPVAAQGLNLGLRDVAVLARLLCEADQRGDDPGAAQLLDEYARLRRRDHGAVTVFTDGLVRIFSSGFAPLVLARNIGLLAADLLPPVKNYLARRSAGVSHAKLAVMLSESRRKLA